MRKIILVTTIPFSSSHRLKPEGIYSISVNGSTTRQLESPLSGKKTGNGSLAPRALKYFELEFLMLLLFTDGVRRSVGVAHTPLSMGVCLGRRGVIEAERGREEKRKQDKMRATNETPIVYREYNRGVTGFGDAEAGGGRDENGRGKRVFFPFSPAEAGAGEEYDSW
ncbi:predicted protein [Histoplasma capsulatum H143]|uniref:Uncharacterized protein n=1 Tax=Ajellomyces capsulatus (strain H143) TaxID=544712 RepID=C6HDR9_AJECH|nr:predicted protein [Histoplasma capsulatum H143]